MLNFQFDYFRFKYDADKFVKKLKKTQHKTLELSDEGGARFSKQVAEEFAVQLKADYLSGVFESRVAALRPSYERWKDSVAPGNSIGELTGSMISNITAWRSRMAARGYVVGIKDWENEFDAKKLYWLEKGTIPKGKGGAQPPRPIFAMSLNRYVGSNYGRHVETAAQAIKDMWK